MTDLDKKPFDGSRWGLIFLVLAVSLGSVLYRIIVKERLEQTSVLFIGIPAILAIVLALTPKVKTVTGGILKGITIALLLSGPLLGEGFVCILMASPLFYTVGIGIGAAVDRFRKSKGTTLACMVLALLPMSIEGSSPRLSLDRQETVQAVSIVNAPVLDVESALAHSPRTDLPLPFYLRLGFPRATQARGDGIEIGSIRVIHFAGGEGRPGDLVMRVEESRAGYLRFAAIQDHSKVAHWLDWRSAEIEWSSVDPQHTRVMWKLSFARHLDPAWYFRPWERYAAKLAAEYLIEANATPSSGAGR
jgi:hypothetical protein